jgi:hypothetical protein
VQHNVPANATVCAQDLRCQRCSVRHGGLCWGLTAEVVAAVRGGLLSLEDALERYRLTSEEFLAWQRSIDRHGLAGLRTTRIQQYR